MTCFTYLVVAFKDPGYVTSYVLRGEDYEDEIGELQHSNKQDDPQSLKGQAKKQLKKAKQSILSKAGGAKMSRKERLSEKAVAIGSTLQTNANNPYYAVFDHS